MDEEKLASMEDLPVDVSELGELKSAKQECPGVYYLAMKPEDCFDLLSQEYYLVLENAPISQEKPEATVSRSKTVRVWYSLWVKRTAEIRL